MPWEFFDRVDHLMNWAKKSHNTQKNTEEGPSANIWKPNVEINRVPKNTVYIFRTSWYKHIMETQIKDGIKVVFEFFKQLIECLKKRFDRPERNFWYLLKSWKKLFIQLTGQYCECRPNVWVFSRCDDAVCTIASSYNYSLPKDDWRWL